MKVTSYLGAGSRLLTPMLLVWGFCISPAATAATSYLQELEAEAASVEKEADGSGGSGTPTWSSQQAVSNGETLDKGLTRAKFEESLKSRYYGSYLFYSTLSDKKQQAVYREYQNNNEIEHLREAIKAQMTN